MSPARQAAVIVAGVFALVAVVVAVVFVFARNATKPPAPAGAVTVTQPASADSSASGTPTSPPSPTVDPETQAHDALVADRARSLQGLTLDGRWVLQLSSKSDGIVDPQQTAANGSHTFHYTDIQAQFDQLSALARSAGMAPMMLTANDFGTKRTQNGDQLWVLLADPGRLGSQEAAQAACAALFPTGQRCRLVQRLRAPHSGALTVASPDRPRPGGIDTTCTPAAFFVVWTVLFLTVGRISVSGNLSGIPFLGTAVADVAVGISPATGLLMAVWGLLVEVCARLLAPLARRRFPGLAALLLVRAWAGSPSTGVVSPAAEVPVNPGVAAAELDPDQSAATASTLIRPRVIGPASGAPALTDRQRKQLTFWSVLAGGLCAVGLVGLLTIRWLGSAFFGPATVAEQYLADLQAGDAAAASALADPGVPNGLRGGLTNAVLGGSSARLDSVLVGEPTITESSATIPVQYSVDGQKVNTTLNAERAGSSFAVFPSWRLTSSLAQAVSVSSAVGVNISGTDVATTSPDSTDSSNHVTTYLYPGSYSVTGAKGGATAKWLIPTEASVTLTSPGSLPKTVSIATKPSPALIEELNAQAKSLIDSCAASGLASPKSTLGECPFSTYSSDGKATWKVASYPQLEVDTSAFSQTLYASTGKAGSVQGTTSSALFGPSTNPQWSACTRGRSPSVRTGPSTWAVEPFRAAAPTYPSCRQAARSPSLDT